MIQPETNQSITERVRQIINQIKFRDWKIEFKQVLLDNEEAAMIRAVFFAFKGRTYERTCGRWWTIESGFTEDQIVKTIFSAIEQAVIHETMKDFTYKGTRIFSPYKDVEDLAAVKEKHLPQDIDF